MSNVSKTRKYWTPEEDNILRQEALSQLKASRIVKDWNGIASKLPGRSNKDCRKRWCKVGANVNKGLWSPDEDDRLRKAVDEHGYSWTLVAHRVQTRHADQCAKRWSHFLDPNLSHEEWDSKDEERLLVAVQKYGHAWKTISETEFPHRSATDIKNRYIILGRRLKTDGMLENHRSSSSSAPSDNEMETDNQIFEFNRDFSRSTTNNGSTSSTGHPDEPDSSLCLPPIPHPDADTAHITITTRAGDPAMPIFPNTFDLSEAMQDVNSNGSELDLTSFFLDKAAPQQVDMYLPMMPTPLTPGSQSVSPGQHSAGLQAMTPEHRYTLVLEDVRPEVLSRVMNVVFESPEHVKLKVVSAEQENAARSSPFG